MPGPLPGRPFCERWANDWLVVSVAYISVSPQRFESAHRLRRSATNLRVVCTATMTSFALVAVVLAADGFVQLHDRAPAPISASLRPRSVVPWVVTGVLGATTLSAFSGVAFAGVQYRSLLSGSQFVAGSDLVALNRTGETLIGVGIGLASATLVSCAVALVLHLLDVQPLPSESLNSPSTAPDVGWRF